MFESDIATCLLTFNELKFDSSYFELATIAQPPIITKSVNKRMAEFFYGRLAAKLVMSDIGVNHNDVLIGSSGEPLWPLGYIGSITHTAGLAAAVFAPKTDAFSGIGIDIERVARRCDFEALHELVIDERERACLQGSPAKFTDAMLSTIAFSAKESIYKAAFSSVGRFFDFSAARVIEPPDDTGRLTLVIAEDLGKNFQHGRRCMVEFRLLRPDVVCTFFILQP
ncbi:4'-phosphopantetheinyl transferase [Hydrogenophaga soli]